jgi:hypothetical protein
MGGTRLNFYKDKGRFKSKGRNGCGPDDYLSPEEYKKIIDNKPKDEKADAEWRRGMFLSMKANGKRR